MPLATQRHKAAEAVEAPRLSAGRVSVSLSPTGTALRDIAFDREVVFRGLAFVARDADWGTLPLAAAPKIRRTGEELEIEAAGSGVHVNGDLSWRVLFRITPSGVEVRSSVHSSQGFRTNRTGLVVLHGLSACRGQEALITHSDGRTSRAPFPVRVSPHQPFMDIGSMAHRTVRGTSVRIVFEGEVFETEDQRNWTDASYKTYSRPLARPFPYMISPGETVEQSVRIDFEPGASAPTPADERPHMEAQAAIPRLATGLPVVRPVLDERTLAALETLGFDSIALEIDPEEEGWADRLAGHLAAFPGRISLDCRMQGAADPLSVLGMIRDVSAGRRPGRISLWGARQDAVEAARALWPGVPIGGGTGAFFAEFNRGSLPSGIDYASWTTNPTVHASDDDTLGESVEPLADILATARAKAPGVGFAIGPLTLVMRYNPNATSPETQRAEPPPDPRQHSGIAASWLLGTVAGFLDAAVQDLTLFEASGPKGLIQPDGSLSPAAHLVARLTSLMGCPAESIVWPYEPRARGLLVQAPRGRVLVLTQARSEAAILRVPEGSWSVCERLGPGGFAASPQAGSGSIEVEGFGVVWLAETS